MALRMVTDFEHAAVGDVHVDPLARVVYFAAPLGGSPLGMWFHFKIDGGDGSVVTFILTNREQMLGSGDYGRTVPTYRTGAGDWRRVDPTTCRTYESYETQVLVDPRLRDRQTFEFDVPCGPGVTEIAFCYPYTLDMLDDAMTRWSRTRGAQVISLGRSSGGRQLRVVRVGREALGRKAIWVLARQHSGEVPGSFVAQAIVDAVLGSGAWAADLRRQAVVYVCPVVDVDGVAAGLYGKDRDPVDFNRDWCAHPRHRGVALLRKAMLESQRRCGRPLELVLDLHGPSAGGVSFPVPPHPAWAGREPWRNAWWFSRLVERYCSSSAPIRWASSTPRHVDWSTPATGGGLASAFAASSGLARTAMSLELAYHWHANGGLVSREDWRQMGQSIARAIREMCRHPSPPKTVQPPEPSNYLSPFWAWLNLPRDCNARVNGDLVSVQADSPHACAALLFRDPLPVARGRFAAMAAVSRTSHGKCPVTRLIFFMKDGQLTGEVCEQSGELGGQGGVAWRGPVRRKWPADAARVAVILRAWPGTITIGRPAIGE